MEPSDIATTTGEISAPQEWTLRYLALAAVLSLGGIGAALVWREPEWAPTVVMTIVTALVSLLAQIVGIKAALSPPSEPKAQ